MGGLWLVVYRAWRHVRRYVRADERRYSLVLGIEAVGKPGGRQHGSSDLSLVGQIAISIALLWVAVGLNAVTLDIGKWIPNLGAVLKIVVFVAVIGGAILYTQDHGMANAISLKTLKPDWGAGARWT